MLLTIIEVITLALMFPCHKSYRMSISYVYLIGCMIGIYVFLYLITRNFFYL